MAFIGKRLTLRILAFPALVPAEALSFFQKKRTKWTVR
jgi:hypothetical protein